MNLRWLEKEDGTKVLQFKGENFHLWYDVLTEKAPRKAREYIVEVFDNRLGPYKAWESEAQCLRYSGNPPDLRRMIKVREVLE